MLSNVAAVDPHNKLHKLMGPLENQGEVRKRSVGAASLKIQ